MLIVSLIPIYSPDNSATGYGESNWNILFWRKIGLIYFVFSVYTITGLTIKAIYTNISVSTVTVNFTGGSVLNLQGLSDLVNDWIVIYWLFV
jgi:hypothetical protein